MHSRPPAIPTAGPQTLRCEACGGTVGEILPGGIVGITHAGRDILVAADGPLTVATSCSRWLRARGVHCNHRTTFVLSAAAPDAVH